MTGHRTGTRLAVAAAVGLSGVLLGAPAPAAALDGLDAYSATAAADGLRQTVTRPESVLVDQVVDAGTPSAQALLDGLGDSKAYGSFVYPGELLLSVPGLLSGPVGQTLPGYPLIASSTYPTVPKADASQGPLAMSASSSPTSSTGSSSFASSGPGFGRLAAMAHVTVDRASGTVTADASSRTEALDVSGVLRIASVSARAEVRRSGGRDTATSSVEVGDITVAGFRVVLTSKGLTLPGQTVPLPDTSPILGPLRDAGVSVELVPSQHLAGGIRSGGLRITVLQTTPDGGEIRTDYTLGQAIALVTSTAAAPQAPPLPPAAAPGATFAPNAPTPGDLGLVQQPAAAPGAPRAAAVPKLRAQPTIADRAASAGQRSLAALPFGEFDTLSIYPVLVLAASTAFASQLFLRRSGVRPIWTS